MKDPAALTVRCEASSVFFSDGGIEVIWEVGGGGYQLCFWWHTLSNLSSPLKNVRLHTSLRALCGGKPQKFSKQQ
jgi:hypothetical protein